MVPRVLPASRKATAGHLSGIPRFQTKFVCSCGVWKGSLYPHMISYTTATWLPRRRHALLDCAMSRSMWALAPEHLVGQMSTCDNPCAKSWLFTMKDTLSHEEFTRLGVTLWAIWSSRRKLIHKGLHQTPHATNAFVASFNSDLQVLAKPHGEPRVAQPRLNQCVPPKEGTCKINVDAALMRTRSVGAVTVVCRDRQEVFLGASMITFHGIDDATTLEALAVRESLALADDLYKNKNLSGLRLQSGY